nr:MAG TPA: hypothetical protein [Caudoviricetes sp.]
MRDNWLSVELIAKTLGCSRMFRNAPGCSQMPRDALG